MGCSRSVYAGIQEHFSQVGFIVFWTMIVLAKNNLDSEDGFCYRTRTSLFFPPLHSLAQRRVDNARSMGNGE